MPQTPPSARHEMVRGSNDRLIVLSHAFWRRQFGADRSCSASVTLGGGRTRSYDAGVVPLSVAYVDVYIPYLPFRMMRPRRRSVQVLSVVARMKPGVTPAQATAEPNAIARTGGAVSEDKNAAAAPATPLQSMVGKSARVSSCCSVPWVSCCSSRR